MLHSSTLGLRQIETLPALSCTRKGPHSCLLSTSSGQGLEGGGRMTGASGMWALRTRASLSHHGLSSHTLKIHAQMASVCFQDLPESCIGQITRYCGCLYAQVSAKGRLFVETLDRFGGPGWGVWPHSIGLRQGWRSRGAYCRATFGH